MNSEYKHGLLFYFIIIIFQFMHQPPVTVQPLSSFWAPHPMNDLRIANSKIKCLSGSMSTSKSPVLSTLLPFLLSATGATVVLADDATGAMGTAGRVMVLQA